MALVRFCSRQLAFSATTTPLISLFIIAGLLPLAYTQSIPLQLSNIFKNTNEAEWEDSTNWYSNSPYCEWSGISCYDDDKNDPRFGKIKMIDLSDNRLVGTISPDIWKLSDLQTLELRNNPFVDINFNGIEEARSLEKLILTNTGIKSFYGLDAAYYLKELHLTDCGLVGTIPEQVYELKDLEGFYGNYNKFTGSLPDKIGQLTQLKDLYLYDNEITGTLPDAMGNMDKLESLTLSFNDLSGTLPADALNKLTELQFLAINRDYGEQKGGITGPLPSLDNLKKLTEIYLQNNLITGNIPTNFLWNAPKEELVIIDISDNVLTGNVESERLKDFKFMMLSATGNRFTGIDPEICDIEDWNDGGVGYYGCEAIVCPVRTYAPEGRQTYYDNCEPCGISNVVGAYECATADDTQRKILDKFYWDMDGTNWDLDEWYDEDNECDWNGIVCNYNEEVIEINLSSNGLSGNPGSEIFLLPALQTLDFSENLIDFRFQGIENAKNLVTLTLYGTGLNSLDDIGQLSQTSIRELYLSDNNLEGSIPSNVYDLVDLQILMISFNSFSGKISQDIGKLSNLQILRAYGNNLTGNIPSGFGKLQKLNELILSENDFSGPIPLELSDMPELEEISIHQSTNTKGGLSGTLPDFAKCKNLSTLHLASNSINGPLPDDFLKFTSVLEDVIDVDLSDNEITGAIPSDWDRLPYLEIDLTENKIISISSGLCEKGQWEYGNVDYYGCDAILCKKGTFNVLGKQTNSDTTCEACPSSNYMGATQCGNGGNVHAKDTMLILEALYISTNGKDWNNSTGWMSDPNVCNWYGVVCKGNKVVRISLSNNGLSGVPTNDLYDLLELEELDLQSNGISFNFKGIERATQLRTLYLSSTQIKSLEGIGGAQELTTLHLTDSYLSGPIPNELYSLTKLEHLYLNYNQFSGRLSPDVGNLINLESLYLTANQLSGQIPNHIGALNKLKILTLAENNFGGTIPKEMNDLVSLEVLSLQREMGDERGVGLSGPLPPFNTLPHLQKLDLGYNNLQGSIPVNFLNGIGDKSKSIEVELISNSLEGTVPSSLNQFNKLNIFLADNDFRGLAPGLCNMKDWMNGEVASNSCDAIMCAPGTYSEYGRYKDSGNKCEACPVSTSSFYWGSFSCITGDIASAQGEQAILEMLYTSLGGDSWHNHDNWMSSEVSICEWKGITCTSGGGASVQAIRLANNALSGDVPAAIFELENLRDLNLSGNSIELKLEKIGNAKKLQYLNLDDTGLHNLDGIGSAAALMIFHISNNQFEDFPTQILSLNRLETLVMSSNSFKSNLPDLRPLKEYLKFFECDECGLNGPIPEWLNEFKKLEHLSLASNKFVGSLLTIESMSSLSYLDLSDQISRGGGIDGKIPSFSSLLSLSEVYLHKNKLSGPIPDDFLLEVKVSYIRVDLRKNMIEGTIPSTLFKRLDDLTLLLANNKISMIPEEICADGNSYNWNRGDMADFGCDGLLCQPGYYSELGRETDTHKCAECTEAGFTSFYGSTSCGSNTQKDILSQLYSNLGGVDWTHNDGWMETENVCQWYGIECVSGSVTILNLEENGLSGNVPVDLFNIPTLLKINLKSNDISFPFEGIEKLTQLKFLALSDTGISSIEGIGKLSDTLIELHLTDNSLTTFPEELYDLTNLKELYMNYNDIEDTFSPRLGGMTALEHLFVFENKMNGSIPSEIGNLQNLKSLALGGNFFTGMIPTELNKLQNLEILALQKGKASSSDSIHETGLTGTLPAFDKLPKISEIYLANQDLSGTIPDAFLGAVADVHKYILVDLTMNKIQGSLPFSLKKFDKMDIYLGGNEIENIDDSFCSLEHWIGGDVAKYGCDAILCPRGTYNLYGKQSGEDTVCEACPFTYTAIFWGSTSCSADATDYDEREILAIFYDKTGGSGWTETSNWKEDSVSICDWYGVHCASEDDPGAAKVVKQIQLPSNKLTGTVPPQMFGLKHLEMLNLDDNHIDFEFHGIGEALMLKELYLDSTDIKDIEGIGEAKNLKSLHLQQNEFGGSTIPDHLFDLSKLKHLYLSDSNFGGKLPSQIGQLTNLEDFYCHGNDLTGTIPTEIGKMAALEVLVLSENRFIGSIPNEINNLSHLQSLYIDSFTRRNAGLSGTLPSFSSMTALQEIYLGSNSLTGYFPDDFLSGLANKEQKVTIGLKSNRMEGTLPASLSTLSMLDIDISDNLVTGIAGELCLMEKWNKGGVDKFKCNALLCPTGHFNQFGYQLNERTPCKKCGGTEESSFLGATVCQSEVKQRERKILEAFYHTCGGDGWKNKENWLQNDVDICNWHGISCRHGGTVDSILLGSNNLVGTPPREIFQLTGLKWLWLYSNPIKFSFHGIDQAEHLTSLLLDSTGLKSIKGIGNAYQLTDLDLRFNALSGSFPNEISYLINLESLSLTENYLTGTVPRLSRLHRLKSLRLGENMFSGRIPDFSSHVRLKTLDLSGNRMTGEIPNRFLALTGSDKEMFIDLSSNRLKGKIPGSLDRFDKMTLLLKDNFISSIDPDLCDNNSWNDGDIGLFECDGLLCPPGTYAVAKGRQSNDGTQCVECKEAVFYGQSHCLDLARAYSSNSGAIRYHRAGFILSIIFGLILM